MHENNFENQVRDKMQQLGFDPSEAVWSAVDKEINKERKRRPLFWVFFFSGLLLTGAGFYIGTLNQNSNKALITQKAVLKNAASDIHGSGEPQNNHQKTGDEIAGKQSAFNSTDISRSKIGHKQFADNSIAASSEEEHQHSIISGQRPSSTNPIDTEELTAQDANSKPPAVKVNTKNDPQVLKRDSAEALTKTKGPKSNTKKKRWSFGVNMDAGVSAVNQTSFSLANIPAPYLSNSSGYFGPYANTLSATNYKSSGINPGFSYGVGIVVDRYLSERIYISAGIDYHYYSTSMHTGDLNGSTPTSYLNGNTHSYTNKYHFMELPVLAGFQINKSQKTPICWEAGVSVSYLLNSTSLQFDPYTNFYYQNTASFNNFQLNGITSVRIGFHLHQTELQFGPEFQYGITGLFKQTATAQQAHLYYGGVAITIIPKLRAK